MQQGHTSRKTYQDVLNKAADIFGDKEKAYEWYLKPSENFEGLTPYEYIKKKNTVLPVIQFLETYEIQKAKRKAHL